MYRTIVPPACSYTVRNVWAGLSGMGSASGALRLPDVAPYDSAFVLLTPA